jgi:hypothetical protein
LPFKSRSQERYMFAKHPGIAKRWLREFGQPKDLPEHVRRRRELKRRLGG